MANQIQGLRPDGTLPTVARQQVIDLIGENPSVDEMQVRDIVDQRFAELPPVPATEESVIKALGFRMVVSPDPPAEPTYTLSDGTVVRVVWQKPLGVFVPVVPEVPYWSDLDGTVLVPSLVGIEYRLVSVTKGGETTPVDAVIPGGAPFSWSSVVSLPVPYDVRVEAVALPGYVLPNEFAWTHSVPDPDVEVVVTSDAFTRADGWVKSGDLTDAADGGAPLAYGGARTITVDGEKVSSFRVEDGALVKQSASALEAAGASFTDGWNSLTLDAGSEHVRLEFDFTPLTPIPAGNYLTVSIASRSISGDGVMMTFRGTAYGRGLAVNRGVGAVYTQGWPAGRYTLERRGSTVSVTVPGQAPISRSVEIDPSDSTIGTFIVIRDSRIISTASAPDPDVANAFSYSIDNLVITDLSGQ